MKSRFFIFLTTELSPENASEKEKKKTVIMMLVELFLLGR